MWQSLPPPCGVYGVDRNDLVDLDEAGVLPKTARGYGYAYVGAQCNFVAKYVRGVKWTVLLAATVRGSLAVLVVKQVNMNSKVGCCRCGILILSVCQFGCVTLADVVSVVVLAIAAVLCFPGGRRAAKAD